MRAARVSLSLAQLRRLAEAADSPELGAELKAHVLAHAEAYAALFGLSRTNLAQSIEWTSDEGAGKAIAASVRCALNEQKEKRAASKEGAASEAEGKARRSARYARPGSIEVEREALIELLACGEPWLRIVIESVLPASAEDEERWEALLGVPMSARRPVRGEVTSFDVPTRPLRDLLRLRKDARVFVQLYEGRLLLTWGARGRAHLQTLDRPSRTEAIRYFHLPTRLEAVADAAE
ncbi:MAG TPA: hypothetical protein VGI39_34315 [Polyangiaceae bacterium]|jgi:hypothetical protein